jgi:aspartate kinase
MKNTLVMKFGGSSVATPKHFSRIAEIILSRKKDYPRIAIVVSAMGNTTDQLIELAKQVHPEPPQREYDMLLTVGERISISLLAMALIAQKCEAVSFTGSQSGIITCNRHTDARIIEVRPQRLLPHLEAGRIVIVAGFQGVSKQGEITTLGRGGSDTSAVALGVALGAAKVEFFKDVPGICAEDPKKNPQTALLKHLNYNEAMNIARAGAKVMSARSIELAEKNGIPLSIGSFDESFSEMGTWICCPDGKRSSLPIYEAE